VGASGIGLTCGVFLLAGCAVAPAESARAYEGLRIVAVEFEPARQPLPETELALLVPFRAGDPLELAAVRAAIERLYSSLQFSDIAVDARRVPEGVVLKFITEKNWFIGRVAVEGVPEPPNRAQLARATKLELGALFTEEALESAVQNLHQALRDSGYYEAVVKTNLEQIEDTEEINVTFSVEAGPRARFAPPAITGHPVLPASRLAAVTRWERFWFLPGWRVMTEDRLQQGLERIRGAYRKSNRLMATVQLESMQYDAGTASVKPAIRVEAGPKVRVEVAGAKISRGKLRELVPVFQEQSVDGSLLMEGRQNLAEYFQSRGYFDARVEYAAENTGAGEQVIRYTVDRGARQKIVAVKIAGNRYFDQETIRERLTTLAATRLRYRNGRFSRDYLERDRDAILDLYRSNGFPDAEVAAEVVPNYGGRGEHRAVVFRITEGPQWLVAGLDLSGVDLKLYDQVLAQVQSTAGQPYSPAGVAADRDNVLSYYHNHGYPDAAIEIVSIPDQAARRVSLRYTVREGRRLYVRDVLVGGLLSTSPGLVSSRIRMRPGEAFSQSALIDSQRRLYDLGIFATVDVGLQNADGKARSKYVLYQLEEARKYSFTGGFGAEIGRIGGGTTSFESPAGGTGFSPRASLGVSRSNFLGIGHTVSWQTRLSNYQRRALVTYQAPRFRDNEQLSLTFTGLYDDSRNVRTFAAQRVEGAVQFAQRLSPGDTVQYRLAFRRVSIDQNTLKIEPALIDRLSQPVRVGQVSSAFIRDRRDDPLEPRRGAYTSVDLGLATKALASQSNFLRLLGRNSTYHAAGREWIIARSTTFGFLRNLDDRDIPLPERIFGGGATSHRGFPENQAGPRDLVTGFPLGGRAVLVNQIEARFPLVGETVGGVLFHDAGNVYQDLTHLSLRPDQRGVQDFNYMVHAVGMGVRYRTPIGPVRLDLAYSINSPRFIGFSGTREELLTGTGQRNVPQRISRFQFHFSLGQSF
jgi:outer membrane protein assembly complex protein YaeT